MSSVAHCAARSGGGSGGGAGGGGAAEAAAAAAAGQPSPAWKTASSQSSWKHARARLLGPERAALGAEVDERHGSCSPVCVAAVELGHAPAPPARRRRPRPPPRRRAAPRASPAASGCVAWRTYASSGRPSHSTRTTRPCSAVPRRARPRRVAPHARAARAARGIARRQRRDSTSCVHTASGSAQLRSPRSTASACRRASGVVAVAKAWQAASTEATVNCVADADDVMRGREEISRRARRTCCDVGADPRGAGRARGRRGGAARGRRRR